jgi:hypothetical protein
MAGRQRRHCGECGSPLDELQRYCVNCGSRAGPRSAQLTELLRRTRQRYAHSEAPPAAPTPPRATNRRRSGTGLSLPTPRISAILVLVFLGFGVLLGNVAGSPVSGVPASSSRRLKLLLPAGAGPASAQAGTSAPSASSGTSSAGNEASVGESAATPLEETAPARVKARAKAPMPASTQAPAEAPAGSEAPSGGESHFSAPATGGGGLPAIKHVFVIMLADQPFVSVFGPSAPPYIGQTLEHQGELLAHYDAVAHGELADGIALLSGQGPTAETAADCPTYTEITPTGTGAQEQVLGSGCVYPSSTQTLASQLTAKNLEWRAYVQGMGEAGTSAACAHPQPAQPDPSAAQSPGGGAYATFLNPFVYFRGVTGSPSCAADDVGL